MSKLSLQQRLKDGPVFIAEGYIFELERRGYLKAGAYVPEVLLDQPEIVYQVTRDFVHAGSDITLALTYYAHRDKLKTIGRENDLEALNRAALKIAGDVAKETNTLLAGNICNTGVYNLNDKAASEKEIRRQFTEQVQWAADGKVDLVIGETFPYLGEALIALEVIKEAKLPAVVNFTTNTDKSVDGYDWIEACKILADHGADVVGFNCGRGPEALLPLLKSLRDAVDIPIAALPVVYRTTPEQPSFQKLINSASGQSAYTLGLDEFLCTRHEVADFARQAKEIGVDFIGLCCGANPHHVRAAAEAIGRTTPASRYSPDMSQHYIFGSAKYAKKYEDKYRDKLKTVL